MLKSVHFLFGYIFDAKELDEQYKFFKNTNNSEIETDFHKENNFRTSMRGIKIRGVFDSVDEAKSRSEFIKRYDNKFDIYICQVGCWCPWSPNPNDLNEQEFSETQLNTLMKQYKQNMDNKDEVFEQRKADMVSKSKVNNVADDLANQSDPWMANKTVKEETPEEATSEATPEATPEATREATPEATSEATPEATPEATIERTPSD